MGATLDGMVAGTGAVYEAKFMLPWSFSEEFAAEKYMAQLQHNMWVTNARMAALSIITGGGKWVEISIAADPLHQRLLLKAEKKFWRCAQFGDRPHLFGVEPPRPRIEAVRIVDMGASNSWAEFATLFLSTRSAFLDHERAKTELKGLVPEDAKGVWPRHKGQALQGWSGQLRGDRGGGKRCTGRVNRLPPWNFRSRAETGSNVGRPRALGGKVLHSAKWFASALRTPSEVGDAHANLSSDAKQLSWEAVSLPRNNDNSGDAPCRITGTRMPRRRHREFVRFLRLIEWTRSAGEIPVKVSWAKQVLEPHH
jgi:hypothetical protein